MKACAQLQLPLNGGEPIKIGETETAGRNTCKKRRNRKGLAQVSEKIVNIWVNAYGICVHLTQ